jgi:hypothetical protein
VPKPVRPRRSLWLQEALALEEDDGETLRQKLRADVCVVGGGYTGLWTAIRVKELEPAAERGVPGKFPPEPIRFLGGLAVRSAVRRKERREDRGRTVDPLTRRLSAFAPAGFFRVSR